MSFLDDLFGGSAKKRDIGAANAAATSALSTSRAAQLAALNGAVDPARADIDAGMTGATGAINTGYDTARGDLTTNYGNAETAISDGMGRARGLLNPMIELGGKYDKMYGDALGVNGADARTSFYDDNVNNNDQFAYADELAAKQLQTKLNASGITGGRAGALQLRQGAQRVEDRTNQYLDRIKAEGARGAQAGSQLAGMETQAGSQTAGIRTGLGDQLGNLETNRGTQIGNINMTGGQAKAGIGMQNAQAVAGVEGNYGNNVAGNAINYGNAMASTRGSGLNTMLQIAGLGIQGFTPGRTGATAFGNMAGGINSMLKPTNGGWNTTVSRA